MTEMPPNDLLPKSISYKVFADAYTGRQNTVYHLPEIIQSPLVKAADGDIRKEQFYFITDVLTGKMLHCNGIQQLLGFPEKAFNLKKFVQQLQPSHAAVMVFYSAALYNHINTTGLPVKPGEAFLHTTFSIKALSGKYWYCKRSIYPFYVDAAKKADVLLHAFTIVKEYDSEVFSMRIPRVPDQQEQPFKTTLKRLFRQYSGFSLQEYNILSEYAVRPEMNTVQIAEKLSIKRSTVETYHQRIIRKTEDLYHLTPSSAKEAAFYFKRLRFI